VGVLLVLAVEAVEVMKPDEGKLARIRLRSSLWRISSLPSVQCCGRSVLASQGYVGVEVGDQGAGFTGLQTCGSVSACPCCSANEREQRARVIEAAGVAHLRAGGQLVFMTLTLPHDTGDPLADLLGTCVDGWNAIQKSADWRALAKVCGIAMASRAGGEVKRRLAFVRAVEVTHGRSGWHPHLHVLLFVEDLDDDRLQQLRDVVFTEWAAYVVGRGWRAPVEEAFDVQRVVGVSNAEGLARYLAKIQDQYVPGERQWGVHREMARGDRKTGKRWHTRSPFQIAESAANGHGLDLVLWREYERATKGRRIIQPSQGLFAHLGAAGLAAELATDVRGETVTVAEVLPEDWRIVVRFKAIGDVLAAAQVGGGAAVADLLKRLRQWDRALSLSRERDVGQSADLDPKDVLALYRARRQERETAAA
jgi:hypothetical protein